MGKKERWDHDLWLPAHSHALEGKGGGSHKLDLSHTGYNGVTGPGGPRRQTPSRQALACCPNSWFPGAEGLVAGVFLLRVLRSSLSHQSGGQSGGWP